MEILNQKSFLIYLLAHLSSINSEETYSTSNDNYNDNNNN